MAIITRTRCDFLFVVWLGVVLMRMAHALHPTSPATIWANELRRSRGPSVLSVIAGGSLSLRIVGDRMDLRRTPASRRDRGGVIETYEAEGGVRPPDALKDRGMSHRLAGRRFARRSRDDSKRCAGARALSGKIMQDHGAPTREGAGMLRLSRAKARSRAISPLADGARLAPPR